MTPDVLELKDFATSILLADNVLGPRTIRLKLRVAKCVAILEKGSVWAKGKVARIRGELDDMVAVRTPRVVGSIVAQVQWSRTGESRCF